MTEIMARISPDGRIELADERSAKIQAVDAMPPRNTAHLARGMTNSTSVTTTAKSSAFLIQNALKPHSKVLVESVSPIGGLIAHKVSKNEKTKK